MSTCNPPARTIPASLAILMTSVLAACGGGIAESATSTADAMAKIAAAGGVKGKPAPAPAPAPPPAPTGTTGSMTINWVAPTTNADGTPLTDLAGFRLLIGTTSGVYSQTVTIPSASTLTYTVTGLPANTYYAVAKAYDTLNIESSPSIEVSKVIN